jgi:hypothetical protein
MRLLSLTSAALLLALGTAVPALADVLEMQKAGPTTPIPAGMKIAERGMHMKQVEEMFGKPQAIEPPVGDPPIIRWHYPDFIVYFEYSYVIQSVPTK